MPDPVGSVMSESVAQHIARSTSVLTMTTALSRVLGVVRDLFIAQLFGTKAAAQAFVIAFRPWSLSRLRDHTDW